MNKKDVNVLLDFTFDQLINSNIYLGYIRKIGHESMFPYLLGTRFNNDIINLNYTVLNLRKSCNFMYKVLCNYGYLWLIDYMNNIDNISLRKELERLRDDNTRVYIFLQKWYPGIVSNFLQLFKSVKVNWQDVLFPNSFFFMTQHNMLQAVKEPFISKMPFLGVNDSNSNCKKITYFIPGNEKSKMSLFFYYKIFLRHILRVKILEKVYFFLSFNKK